MPVATGFKLEPVAVEVNVWILEELAVEVDAADVIVMLVVDDAHDARETRVAITTQKTPALTNITTVLNWEDSDDSNTDEDSSESTWNDMTRI